MNYIEHPRPDFVTIDPASQGRIAIHISIATADDCRQAALWLLEVQDRFQAIPDWLHQPTEEP